MKRGNDNSQLRAEEVEALNDADEESAGTFRRASTEEMARRKIVRTKRPSTSSTVDPDESAKSSFVNPFNKVTLPISNQDKVPLQNPFSSFGGLVAPPLEKPTSNPFSGFSGLTSAPNPLDNNKNNNSNTSSKFPPVSGPSTTVTSGEESEFQKKLKKLNNSFFSWVSRQITENPVCIWKDGLKDYIKYYDELVEKYGDSSNKNEKPVSLNFKLDEKKPESVVMKPVSNPLPFNSSVAASSSNPPTVTTTDKNLFSFGNTSVQKPVTTTTTTVPTTVTNNTTTTNSNSTSNGFSFDFSKQPEVPTTFSNFKFNAPSATTSQPLLSTSSFTIPPVPAVNFNFSGTNSFASSFSSVPSTVGLPTSSFQFSSTIANKTEENDENNDDDEGEPILEPEKVLRNEADTDDILLDVVCKLFRYDKESNEWKDIGKGSFRITYNPETKKQRMLVRNLIGKITFNAVFYKGMKITSDKKSIRFAAFIANEEIVLENGKNITKTTTELKTFMLKVKDSDLSLTVNKMEEGIASVV